MGVLFTPQLQFHGRNAISYVFVCLAPCRRSSEFSIASLKSFTNAQVARYSIVSSILMDVVHDILLYERYVRIKGQFLAPRTSQFFCKLT